MNAEDKESDEFPVDTFDVEMSATYSFRRNLSKKVPKRARNFVFLVSALVLLLLSLIFGGGMFYWLSLIEESNSSVSDIYSNEAEAIIAFTKEHAHEYFKVLSDFTDLYPARICGSQNLAEGIAWMKQKWSDSNFDDVSLQPVSGTPNWIRNDASLDLLEPRQESLPLLALGNSIATPTEGITANVIVVSSFDELESKKHEIEGKIVLYNCIFTTYGETVIYRVQGAIEAAKYGAVASLVRSITPFSLQTPHTGVMRYSDEVTKIPHAAITLEYADYFQRLQNAGTPIRVHFYMNCENGELSESHNILAEIRGSVFPEEVVLMGGHIDSWDVGRGAMDDAGGVVAAYFALETIQRLALTPKRTIRIIAWVDEENTGMGEKTYFDSQTQEQLSNHVMAIESDEGVFTPSAFSHTADATMGQVEFLNDAIMLMEDIAEGQIKVVEGEGGADTSILHEEANVPVTQMYSDSSIYFYYHHTAADTIDKLSPEELGESAGALAILSFVLADSDIAFTEL